MTTHVPALVVGAGISGLVCAYALRKAGIDAHILEVSQSPGGIIRSERRDGFLLELGPQSFSATDPICELCKELNIEDQIVQAPPKAPRFVLVDGSLRPVPLSPPGFITSPLVRGKTKWSILRDVLGRSTPPEADESIATFVRRKFTPELLDRLVGPFVSGIYAGDPERLSVRAAFPQLYEAEKTAGSIIRGMIRAARANKSPRQRPVLQSFREGNAILLRALAAKLGTALHAETEAIYIQQNKFRNATQSELLSVVARQNGKDMAIEAQHVIVATPTNTAAKLLRNADPLFEFLLGGFEYAPVAVVSLGYQTADIGHDLNGFGFLIPRSAGFRTLGTVWNSSLFPDRAPAGHALLTSFIGGTTDLQAVSLSPQELATLVHSEIAPVLAIRRPPVFSNVEFYQWAIPQYNLGHVERIATLFGQREKHPNLWLVGNYLRGPAMGACVEQAQCVAGEISKRIAK